MGGEKGHKSRRKYSIRSRSEAQCSPACGGREMKILWT